jgi:hypothetical protein
MRGIGGGADEEALRVVSQARFTPGMQRGRPVRVQYSLPILFRLRENSNNGDVSQSDQTYGIIGFEDPSANLKPMDIHYDRTDNGISGRVLDNQTGEPLAGSNIIVDGTNSGTVADMDGNFTINGLDTGKLTINVSYVGYVTARIDL